MERKFHVDLDINHIEETYSVPIDLREFRKQANQDVTY